MNFLFTDLMKTEIVDGEDKVAKCADLYFDDRDWNLRYLVADAGFWLFSRQLLLDAGLLGQPDMESGRWPADLKNIDLGEAPTPEEDPAVSLHHAMKRRAKDAPFLLAGGYGVAYSPALAMQHVLDVSDEEFKDHDPHLRSAKELLGYEVYGVSGRIGEVTDLLLNPMERHIRLIALDTDEGELCLSVDHVGAINFEKRTIDAPVLDKKLAELPRLDQVEELRRPPAPIAASAMVHP